MPELLPGPREGQREAVQARALLEKAERLLERFPHEEEPSIFLMGRARQRGEPRAAAVRLLRQQPDGGQRQHENRDGEHCRQLHRAAAHQRRCRDHQVAGDVCRKDIPKSEKPREVHHARHDAQHRWEPRLEARYVR